MQLFEDLNQQDAITLIVVTHDAEVAKHAHRTIGLHDGRIVIDTTDLAQAIQILHSASEEGINGQEGHNERTQSALQSD